MKVWVVESGHHYGGGEIKSVHETHRGAEIAAQHEAYLRDIQERNADGDWDNDIRYVTITEWEVAP